MEKLKQLLLFQRIKLEIMIADFSTTAAKFSKEAHNLDMPFYRFNDLCEVSMSRIQDEFSVIDPNLKRIEKDFDYLKSQLTAYSKFKDQASCWLCEKLRDIVNQITILQTTMKNTSKTATH